MSMTPEAIQHIENNHATTTINQQLNLASIPLVAVPQNLRMVSIEENMPAPQFFKGEFATPIIQEFVDYANEQNGADVFLDKDRMGALAHFDFGTVDSPAHRNHSAELVLERDPEFTKLLNLDGATLNQRQMVELLEDYHANITPLGKPEVPGAEAPKIELVSAIKSVRDTKVKTESESNTKIEDTSEEQSIFGKVDIDNNAGHLPLYIDWTCIPYSGLKLPLQATNQNDDFNESRTFRLRVNPITDGDRVKFSLRIIMLEEHKQVMAEAFKDQLKKELDEGYNIRIGSWNNSAN